MSASPSRREFVQSLGALAAGAVTAGYTATARGFAANEEITVGCIGTGGRCRRLMESLRTIPGVRIAAVCDIWDHHRAEGAKLAEAKAFAAKDYRVVLDRADIDAVLIGTPDHWHVPITVDACAAGKDVYVEKPLTHDLSEGERVIKAQNEHRRIVQVGTQQRSMPHLQKANEIVKSGQLGTIHKVHLTWNRNANRAARPNLNIDPKTVDWKQFLGNAKEQPFDEYRFRQWRWFWDFGGGIFTDLMVHWIDVVHWYLDLDHPAVATSIGDYFHAKDLWETPDTVQTLLRYPDQELQAYFEGTFSNARNAAMCEFMGTEATLYIDRGRYEVIPERRSKLAASELILGTGPRGADFYDQPDGEMLHLANWIECVRSRKRPNSPAESGVSAASAAHLANLALRSGQVAKWPS
ncbi:MAG: Gfo/Idh/MocA family oxidoreductase [Pirellulaceae bacterium]|jgi:predicted dehydrogenase|nr:Gfo/Idh/MocA family oxidoreductase [Pirellulaceae bacterium]